MPKSFIAHIIQAGVGCDYTIGCGEVLWTLDAETRQKAVDEVRGEILGHYLGTALDSITVFEVSWEAEFPLREWMAEKEQEEQEALQREEEEEERREYERLKGKFD